MERSPPFFRTVYPNRNHVTTHPDSAYCVPYVIPMDMFLIFLISAKSYDITNMFVKFILVQKIARTSIYNIIMSPEHFEIKNKDLRPL